MYLIRNPLYHVKAKHIEVQFHHIQELVTKKKLEVWKVDTEVNIVDFLTNPLREQCFRTLRNMMDQRLATKWKGAE